MIRQRIPSSLRQQLLSLSRSSPKCSLHQHLFPCLSTATHLSRSHQSIHQSRWAGFPSAMYFHSSHRHAAQPPTADALMENLTDLYSTAKDEFEIAAEETEKKTVYAADDREAAKEALKVLKDAYEKAVRESDPETAREVQSRTGPRIKELENALTAVEEMAMED